MNYTDFLESKKHSSINYGVEQVFELNKMFDYQKYVANYLIKKGRCACFLDTGLGKTIIELVTATNYVRQTNKRVLILTPLAVAFQFITEAEKFSIDDIAYSKDGKLKSKIVVCNYERLSKFNPEDFDCVILDESSILKNFEGEIKNQVTAFIKKVKYRFLFTATPSPNDFIELGTSSEALGYLGYTDMLTKFFTNNEDTISPMNIGTKWILKGHAVDSFFDWVSGWSISMRKPSDLGFSDKNHTLPNLITREHFVDSENKIIRNGQESLFFEKAKGLFEIRQENKNTVEKRCEMAVELSSQKDCSVCWVNLNKEGDLISKLDKSSTQIVGSMSIDKKEEILLAFMKGEIKKLITKSTITSFGLNWQHCNHTVYFPTFSYEQYYQSIRRFYRFGQKRDVTVDLVLSKGQIDIMESIKAKSKKADELFSKLNNSINKNFKVSQTTFDKKIKLPKW